MMKLSKKRRNEVKEEANSVLQPALKKYIKIFRDKDVSHEQIKRALLKEFDKEFTDEEKKHKTPQRQVQRANMMKYKWLHDNHFEAIQQAFEKIKYVENSRGCNLSMQGLRKSKDRPTVRFPAEALKVANEGPYDFPSTFTAAHIVCLNNGKCPATEVDECSHLCHQNGCLEPTHLVWESKDNNGRREACKHKQECICGLTPQCFPNKSELIDLS